MTEPDPVGDMWLISHPAPLDIETHHKEPP
jgi:hypothetical protein